LPATQIARKLGRGLAHLDGVHMRLIAGQPLLQIGDQRGFLRPVIAALGHGLAEFRAAELGDRLTKLPSTSARSLFTSCWNASQVNSLSEVSGAWLSSHQRQ
jgi:hypothetical protein